MFSAYFGRFWRLWNITIDALVQRKNEIKSSFFFFGCHFFMYTLYSGLYWEYYAEPHTVICILLIFFFCSLQFYVFYVDWYFFFAANILVCCVHKWSDESSWQVEILWFFFPDFQMNFLIHLMNFEHSQQRVDCNFLRCFQFVFILFFFSTMQPFAKMVAQWNDKDSKNVQKFSLALNLYVWSLLLRTKRTRQITIMKSSVHHFVWKPPSLPPLPRTPGWITTNEKKDSHGQINLQIARILVWFAFHNDLLLLFTLFFLVDMSRNNGSTDYQSDWLLWSFAMRWF